MGSSTKKRPNKLTSGKDSRLEISPECAQTLASTMCADQDVPPGKCESVHQGKRGSLLPTGAECYV